MSEIRKERTYTVTEEEYREELAHWSADDEDLKPGTCKIFPNRFKAKPRATDPKNFKVNVTTYLDTDVLDYFKKRTEEPNAPHQTQINNELRKVMENGSADTGSVEREILNDRTF